MITQRELKELLSYDPETGIFKWKRISSGRMRKNLIAGCVIDRTKESPICIGIRGKVYKAHRLAWIYMYGNIYDKVQIDHINGKKKDNRICNLRLATSSQNVCNSKRRIDNTSGYKGVSFDKTARKWVAYISFSYKRRELGYFEDKEKAAHAYDVAALDLHGKFAKTNFDWQEY